MLFTAAFTQQLSTTINACANGIGSFTQILQSSNVMHNCVDSCHIYTAHLSPALNESSDIRHFERSDTIEIRNGIIFDFYTGLPHIRSYLGNPTFSLSLVAG